MRVLVRATAMGACALLLAGCSAAAGELTSGSSGDPAASASASAAPSRHPSPTPEPPPTAQARLAGHRESPQPWDHPVTIEAVHGTISKVAVRDGKRSVAGRLAPDAKQWRSTGRLTPATSYSATVSLVGTDGRAVTRTLRFKTTKASKLLTITATPGPGWTRGVAEPVDVFFNAPVVRRAAVERHLSITTSRGRVAGAWHWFSPTSVHFRPRHFWPADTTVHVHVDLAGVYAGHGWWGDRNHDWSWRVGDSHVSYVSATQHTFRVTENGRTVHRWPTGMGKPQFPTRSGVYLVLGKSPLVRMTSCSVGLSCTPGTPNYYDLKVHWDTRITDSGTFVHAAPWDALIGAANTSHGCIHLTTADAKQFYDMAAPGDVVIVRGTGRPPNPSDSGMADWNMSWRQWLAGSALH